jgi:hypothetical protein
MGATFEEDSYGLTVSEGRVSFFLFSCGQLD